MPMESLLEGARSLGLELTEEQLRAFQIYYEELIAWNERFNLTAITDYEGVQIKHFLDSLTCLLAVQSPGEAIDVGTGAGFPGLPLKIVRPELRLTLLEARGKKVAFLEHLIERLGLKGVRAIKGRAEELGRDQAHRERYDLALARALAKFPTLLEYTLPFCRIGGLVVAQRGTAARREVEEAAWAISVLGGRLRRILTLRLLGLEEPRHLVVIEKVAPTPGRYPRRPGMVYSL